jgi:hypothetical protein
MSMYVRIRGKIHYYHNMSNDAQRRMKVPESAACNRPLQTQDRTNGLGIYFITHAPEPVEENGLRESYRCQADMLQENREAEHEFAQVASASESKVLAALIESAL